MRAEQCTRVSTEKSGFGVSIDSLVDSMAVGILLFKESGELALTNKLAQQLIDARDWLWVADHRLRSKSPQMIELDHSIKQHVSRQRTLKGSTILLSGPDKKDNLLFTVAALDTHDGGSAAVGLVVDPAETRRLDAQVLQDLYGLTDAETHITELIASGHDYKGVAEIRQVAVATVRSTAKSIFKKLAVDSRAGVVHKVHASMSPLALLAESEVVE